MRITAAFFLFCCLASTGAHAAPVEKTIYGLNEYVWLSEFPVQLAAKLDTGAKTASLSARDVQRFKRNGETWVRFRLAVDGADGQVYEHALARISKIKRRAGDYDPEEDEKTYTARPVIELDLCMGKVRRSIEVNLTDRSAFQYPLLIGSDALELFGALIDPSLTYSAGKPDCTANDAE
jgi:hypothetical protein